MKISVVINTYNAAKHLEKVLESVKDFDEIVLCDMYSSDNTVEIAKRYNCKIIYHEYVGYVEPARKMAVDAAMNEWVLIVDADELVPPALRKYLYEQIKNASHFSGIRINRKNYFMGRFMRCTYPDRILRFLRKSEAFFPLEIHVPPKIKGNITNIPTHKKELALIHLANESIQQLIKKIDRYTEYERIRRKNLKYGYFSLMNESLFRFFKLYIIKGACFDGKPGLVYAGLMAFYKYVTISKLWESKFQYDDLNKEIERLKY